MTNLWDFSPILNESVFIRIQKSWYDLQLNLKWKIFLIKRVAHMLLLLNGISFVFRWPSHSSVIPFRVNYSPIEPSRWWMQLFSPSKVNEGLTGNRLYNKSSHHSIESSKDLAAILCCWATLNQNPNHVFSLSFTILPVRHSGILMIFKLDFPRLLSSRFLFS